MQMGDRPAQGRKRRFIAMPDGLSAAFAAMPGTSVIFDTGPGALTHADSIAPLEPLGLQPTGFLRFRLRL